MDADFGEQFTIPIDQYQPSEKFDKDRQTKTYEWNAFIRKRGREYAACRLSGFQFHGNQNEQKRQRDHVDKLRRYATTVGDRWKHGQGIVLVGPTGTGKDHCLTAIARPAILENGLTIAWIDGASFFSTMRDRISEGLTERGAMRPLMDADILYLSDPVPASGGLSDYQKDRLFDLINSRGKKPTWVSCNFESADEARDILSPQLAGRLRDRALVLGFNWPSYRVPAPHDGPAADEWWKPVDDDPEESPAPSQVAAAPYAPGGGFPVVNKYDLRDGPAVSEIFANLLSRGLVDESDRRGVFRAAFQASLSSRKAPGAQFRRMVEQRVWQGGSPEFRIAPKSVKRGDEMLAAASETHREAG